MDTHVHWRTTRFDIDMMKCIYCGFCQEAWLGRKSRCTRVCGPTAVLWGSTLQYRVFTGIDAKKPRHSELPPGLPA